MSLESLLRVSTLGAEGDPDVGDGVHVSVSLNPVLGWPLHPFACGIAENAEANDIAAHWFDRYGRSIEPPFEIDAEGPVTVLLHGIGAAGDPPWCWVRVLIDGDDAIVDALDPIADGRPFARRTAEPYSFGASAIRRLRLSGHGTVEGVIGVSAARVVERFQWFEPFGLPIDDAAWYAGGMGEGPALDRVARAAPQRLGPPDDPEMAGVPVTAGDEVDRITGLRDQVLPWIKAAFHGSVPPDQAVLTFTTPAHDRAVPHADPVPQDTHSGMPCVPALTAQAADPGLARYLGMATTLPVAPPYGDEPMIVVVGAWFAFHGARKVGPWRLRDLIPESRLEGLLADAITADLSALRERLGRGREIRVLPVVAGVGATPDRPPAPDLSAPPGAWRGESWQQQILLRGTPPAGPVALARLTPGGTRSLHRVHGNRAVVLLAGTAQGASPADRPNAVADIDIPVDPGGASWQVVQADRFGRWGDPASVSGPLPPRPRPRQPVLRSHILSAALDRGDTAPRSPATLRLDVTVPETLECGALPLSTVEFTVDGTVAALPVADEVTHEAPAPDTLPGQQVAVTVSAVFIDEQDGRSDAATSVVTVHDPRPLPVVRTGPALLWSGRQDPTGGSELALAWPAPSPDARYRVYLAGSERLAGQLDGLRASLAGDIWHLRETLADRGAFSLITDEPLAPVDGVVSLRHTLPGTLRGVVFVRVVPVTQGGVQADFARCGLVPVAVPHGEVPPSPTVRATAGQDGVVTISVEADGISARLLTATSPGRPPEARVRRARTAVDPFFAPVVAAAPLTESRPGVWTATLTDTPPGLLPYQQVTYWAEVRYPPELALPDDVMPVPVDDGVTTPPGVPTGDVESLWSPPSLPTTAMLVPETVPDITGALTYTRDAGTDVISGALPEGGLTIQLWAKTPTALVAIDSVEAGPDFTYTVPTTTATAYYARLSDPLGRGGDLTEIAARGG